MVWENLNVITVFEGYELEFVGEGGIIRALFAVGSDDIELVHLT
jgi:hypothetical protein